MVTPHVDMPSVMTVYVKVLWTTLPSSNQTIIAQDGFTSSFPNPLKLWHLKGVIGGIAVTMFKSGTGTIATYTVVLSIGTWYVIVGQYNLPGLQFSLNGVDSSSVMSEPSFDQATMPICLGGRNFGGTIGSYQEPLTGFVHEARVYSAIHSPSQIAAVVAQIT